MKLWHDLETYSDVPITHGTHAYAEGAEVLLWAYAIDDGPVAVWDLTTGAPMPLDLRLALIEEDEVWAHNSHFDRTVLRHTFPAECPPVERWRDTMVQALSHSLPGALGSLCTRLGIEGDQAKDADGKRLIQLFCKPRPKGYKLRRATRETHPEDWAAFVSYAGRDIEAMRAAHKRMPKWNYPNNLSELALWHRDQRINDRGITVDMDLVHSALATIKNEQALLAARAHNLTDGEVSSATRRDVMLNYLVETRGLFLDDLRGATVERMLEDESLEPGLRELLMVRLQATTSSTAKYKALDKAVSSDGRIRGLLQFCGAARTGRWAGRIFQPQNLPRPSLKQHQIDAGILDVKRGVASFTHDNAMELLSSALRGALIAAPGKKLCVADLSNIEGRKLAWLSGEEWKLQAFRDYDAGTGHDLYALAYAKAFGVTPEAVMDNKSNGDGSMRQIGKVQELALGFQGGVGAFVTFATAFGIDLEALARQVLEVADPYMVKKALDTYEWFQHKGRDTYSLSPRAFAACEVIKTAWREAHAATVNWWASMEAAFRSAIHAPGEAFKAGPVAFTKPLIRGKPSQWVLGRLPSGRFLCYPNARIKYASEKDMAGKLVYDGVNQYTRKWGELQTYGGKLAENFTQAAARDVIAYNLSGVEAAGYEMLLSVHDEDITEAPDTDDYSGEHLAELISIVPEWAPGLPLSAEGFTAYSYRK